MTSEAEYIVQIYRDARSIVRGNDTAMVHGLAWHLCKAADGDASGESIVASPAVFDIQQEAEADALAKLSKLRCPIDRPLDKAIRWMLNDM